MEPGRGASGAAGDPLRGREAGAGSARSPRSSRDRYYDRYVARPGREVSPGQGREQEHWPAPGPGQGPGPGPGQGSPLGSGGLAGVDFLEEETRRARLKFRQALDHIALESSGLPATPPIPAGAVRRAAMERRGGSILLGASQPLPMEELASEDEVASLLQRLDRLEERTSTASRTLSETPRSPLAPADVPLPETRKQTSSGRTLTLDELVSGSPLVDGREEKWMRSMLGNDLDPAPQRTSSPKAGRVGEDAAQVAASPILDELEHSLDVEEKDLAQERDWLRAEIAKEKERMQALQEARRRREADAQHSMHAGVGQFSPQRAPGADDSGIDGVHHPGNSHESLVKKAQAAIERAESSLAKSGLGEEKPYMIDGIRAMVQAAADRREELYEKAWSGASGGLVDLAERYERAQVLSRSRGGSGQESTGNTSRSESSQSSGKQEKKRRPHRRKKKREKRGARGRRRRKGKKRRGRKQRGTRERSSHHPSSSDDESSTSLESRSGSSSAWESRAEFWESIERSLGNKPEGSKSGVSLGATMRDGERTRTKRSLFARQNAPSPAWENDIEHLRQSNEIRGLQLEAVAAERRLAFSRRGRKMRRQALRSPSHSRTHRSLSPGDEEMGRMRYSPASRRRSYSAERSGMSPRRRYVRGKRHRGKRRRMQKRRRHRDNDRGYSRRLRGEYRRRDRYDSWSSYSSSSSGGDSTGSGSMWSTSGDDRDRYGESDPTKGTARYNHGRDARPVFLPHTSPKTYAAAEVKLPKNAPKGAAPGTPGIDDFEDLDAFLASRSAPSARGEEGAKAGVVRQDKLAVAAVVAAEAAREALTTDSAALEKRKELSLYKAQAMSIEKKRRTAAAAKRQRATESIRRKAAQRARRQKQRANGIITLQCWWRCVTARRSFVRRKQRRIQAAIASQLRLTTHNFPFRPSEGNHGLDDASLIHTHAASIDAVSMGPVMAPGGLPLITTNQQILPPSPHLINSAHRHYQQTEMGDVGHLQAPQAPQAPQTDPRFSPPPQVASPPHLYAPPLSQATGARMADEFLSQISPNALRGASDVAANRSRNPNASPASVQDSHHAAPAKLAAVVKGHRIRSFMRTQKVQNLLRQVKDTSKMLVDITQNGQGTADPLWKPMHTQLRSQKQELYSLFFPTYPDTFGIVYAREMRSIRVARQQREVAR